MKLTKLLDNQQVILDPTRNYIGASSIGSDCLRQVWYEYNGYPSDPITPRLARTFEIGKRLEGMVLDHLEKAGFNLVRDWWDLADNELPYFRGHVDAVWNGKNTVEAIIEVKTAKDSSFNQFVKHGLRKWSFKYFSQVQAYMGMSEIHSAYVICLNKDTSALHDEFVKYDPEFYECLQMNAEMIHEAKEPPRRVNESPGYYLCKMCKFNGVCRK